MKFVYHKDRTLPTRQGHTIAFKKGVLTQVPLECHDEVLAIGAVPETELEEVVKKNVNEPNDPIERKAKIMSAFEALATENKRGDFAANGVPSVNATFEKLGFKIDPKERDTLWVEFNQTADARQKDADEAVVAAKVKGK